MRIPSPYCLAPMRLVGLLAFLGFASLLSCSESPAPPSESSSEGQTPDTDAGKAQDQEADLTQETTSSSPDQKEPTPGDPEPDDSEPAAFENVSLERGIDFLHDHCGTGQRFMVETNCSGIGWLDFDRDGHMDLYFGQGAPVPGVQRAVVPTNCLYHNQGDGTFVEMGAQAGVADQGITMGVACADFDGDGWHDIYVCNYGMNRLFRNLGNGTFEDVTESSGTGQSKWSSTAAFADFDLDGDLDLYVANYVDFAPERKVPCGQTKQGVNISMYCHPDAYDGIADTLYRNNGDGTFTDMSQEAGLLDVDFKESAKGLCVVASDYDDDGDMDLFVANDAAKNYFFRNDGDWKFKEIATDLGVAFNRQGKTESCMGSDWADVDGDGDFDLITCNIQRETNTLWVNEGGGFFDDVSRKLALANPVSFSSDSVLSSSTMTTTETRISMSPTVT